MDATKEKGRPMSKEKRKIVELPPEAKQYALIHSNGEHVSAVFDTYEGEMSPDDLAVMMASATLCAASSIADPEESPMEVYIKLIDWYMMFASDRWGDKFKEALELHKINQCSK